MESTEQKAAPAAEGPPATSQGWRARHWLGLLELALVVGLVVADTKGLVFFSKTPYYFLLGWLSLRLCGLRWRDVGLSLPAAWPRLLLLGLLLGTVQEVLSSQAVEPALAHLFGKEADMSDFRPLVGNLRLLALVLAVNLVLAAFGEEAVYRGYLMNRVAGLLGGQRGAWILSLCLVSALFGWAHVDQGVTGQIQAGIDGLLLGAIYLASGRNLFLPMVTHAVSNSLAFVLIYLGRYPGL